MQRMLPGGDFTAQDVIDGKIVDVAANMAKFPITPIHSTVGCDCRTPFHFVIIG